MRWGLRKHERESDLAALYVHYFGERKPRKIYIEKGCKWHIENGLLLVTNMGDIVVAISLENVISVSESRLK